MEPATKILVGGGTPPTPKNTTTQQKNPNKKIKRKLKINGRINNMRKSNDIIQINDRLLEGLVDMHHTNTEQVETMYEHNLTDLQLHIIQYFTI